MIGTPVPTMSATEMAAEFEHIEKMPDDPIEAAIREAHALLVWTYQQAIVGHDKLPQRGWWHVKDLNPDAAEAMNAGERDLYDALLKLPSQ